MTAWWIAIGALTLITTLGAITEIRLTRDDRDRDGDHHP